MSGSFLDNIFSGLSRSMTKEEAFYAILITAAVVDGPFRPNELDELTSLARRSRILSSLSPRDLAALRERLEPRLTEERLPELVAEAMRSHAPLASELVFVPLFRRGQCGLRLLFARSFSGNQSKSAAAGAVAVSRFRTAG